MSLRCCQVEVLELYYLEYPWEVYELYYTDHAGERDRFVLRLLSFEAFESIVRKVRVSFSSVRAGSGFFGSLPRDFGAFSVKYLRIGAA